MQVASMFDARNWYWLADDGRVFASGRQAIIDSEDAHFQAARSQGKITRWPEDDAGAQTNASLQLVLSPYALWVDLVAYAAHARWRKEIGGIVIAGVPVATDDRSKLMITGARVAAVADPNWSTAWVGSDGQIYPVDVDAMLGISDGVQVHVNATFGTFANVMVAIEAGELSTPAEIDGEFGWPAHEKQ